MVVQAGATATATRDVVANNMPTISMHECVTMAEEMASRWESIGRATNSDERWDPANYISQELRHHTAMTAAMSVIRRHYIVLPSPG